MNIIGKHSNIAVETHEITIRPMLGDSPILIQRDDVIGIWKMMRCNNQVNEWLAQI